VTVTVGFVFVAAGDVDFVAQIISMFSMVTYGSVCPISFLEHFTADPAHRPVFRSRWYVSGFGAAMCLWLMAQMSVLCERSRDADLVMIGFRAEALRHQGAELFEGYEGLGNILFVSSRSEKCLA